MKNLCKNCPRHCQIDRSKEIGYCGATSMCQVAKVMTHYWEEPIISGGENTELKGSGAIFFSHCNLKCVYCQNYEISHSDIGELYTPEELAMLFKKLENEKVANINLVSPTHYSSEILSALKIYKPNIPVVWNTNGYESVEIIESLKGYVDIFLCDFKYFDSKISSKYSNCDDYFQKVCLAIKKMREICPKDIIKKGLMKSGLIIRHLILPSYTKDSSEILRWIANNLGTKIYISLMSQFTPIPNMENYPELNRKLMPIEYKIVVNYVNKLGFKNGFLQELESANSKFIPTFK